jgi:hypothetical protein
MNMPPTQPSNNAVIISRLEGLSCDLVEIKLSLKEMQDATTNFRIDYERRHAVLEAKTKEAHDRLDDQDKELTKITDAVKAIPSLVFQARILNWIAGVAGVSFITLIIAILTHQVTLSF